MTIQQKFRSAVRRGTGEAHLIMKKNPNTDFSEEIFKAIIKDYAYDTQSEGGREVYFYELIQLSKHREKLIRKVINALKRKRKDYWVIELLFKLNAEFAKAGNDFARKVVYEQFMRKSCDEVPWIGEEAIILMDGYAGIKFLAEFRGKQLMEESDSFYDTGFLDTLPETIDRRKVLQDLKRISESNVSIKKYLNVIFKPKINSTFHKIRVSYNYLKGKIDNNQYFFWITPKIAKMISNKMLNRIADDFISETELSKKINYFKLFSKRKFPYGYKQILDVVDNIKTNQDRDLEFAVDSLKFFKGKTIRDFALRKLRSGRNAYTYLDLLVNNYKSSDSKLIFNLVRKQNTTDKAHLYVWVIEEIYSKNKDKECKKIIEHLYYRLNCGSHRYSMVKILKDNNILSNRIRKEAKYDSYLKTRLLVA